MTRRRRPPARLVLPLAFLLLTSCAAPSADPAPSAETADSNPAEYATDLEDATNAARADEGLPPLAPSSCARDAASVRATALVDSADLTHAPMDEVFAGCDVDSAGENLSRSDHSASAVVSAWMGSSGHRANILDPTWTHLGVACVTDGDDLLCSQVFLGP